MQRKNYFRLFLMFGLLLGVAAVVSACGGDREEEKDTAIPVVMDISALSSQLQKELGLEEELSPVEGEVFSYVYEVTPESYREVVLLLSSGAAADEICIVKAAGEDGRREIKEKMLARMEMQKASFASYLPQEGAKLDNAVIKEIDDYLILVVCANPEQAEKTLQQAINQKNK